VTAPGSISPLTERHRSTIGTKIVLSWMLVRAGGCESVRLLVLLVRAVPFPRDLTLD
jgi:hypothetical protein